MVLDMVLGKGADKEVSVIVSILVTDVKLVVQPQILDQLDQHLSVEVFGKEVVTSALKKVYFFVSQ